MNKQTKYALKGQKRILWLVALAALFTACSNIDETERLIYVEPAVPTDSTQTQPADSLWDAPATPVARRVLIEDHTGQKCPNCPDAAKLIHEFQQVYGEQIVPVAIHSASLGIMEPEGLGNELGNTYFNAWKMNFKPAGMVNRLDGGDGPVLDKTTWTAAVTWAVTLDTPLDIRIKAEQDADNAAQASVSVKVLCTKPLDAPVNAKLQVWVTEDSIVAPQDDLGNWLTSYVHNHVLRATLNGTWGEDISLNTQGQELLSHYTLPISTAWQPRQLAIVAFVYTDDEVLQAARAQLKTIQ